MLNAIAQFFTSLSGVTFPTEILSILAFGLCAWLVGALVGCFSAETRRWWNFSVKVCIIALAVIYVAQTLSVSLIVGGA